MKRAILLLLLLAVAGATGAAEPARDRYLVATRGRPDRKAIERWSRSEAPAVEFRTVDGYAASLTSDEVAQLRNDRSVLFVEKDPRRYLDAVAPREHDADVPSGPHLPDSSAGTVRPFDTTSTQSEPAGVSLVRADAVWKFGRGRGVKVGVVDTGVDGTHPDLAANFRGGKSFIDGVTSFGDEVGHGTHVAGTIAALDNMIGVVGVAPEAEIYSLRVFDSTGEFTNASALIQAIDWATAHGIKILNMSLGGPESSVLEQEAFARAASNGILVFAASGNDGKMVVNYPAAYPGAIAVGAVSSAKQLAIFSTFGSFVKLVAPGVGVLSTVPVGSASLAIITGPGLPPIEGDLMTNSPHGSLGGPYVDCGTGHPENFPAAVSGKIALIKRGELTFADKAKNAKAAGATGVIVFNNVEGPFSGTLGDEAFDWPVTISISLENGEAMQDAPAGTAISTQFQDYGYLQGTSMACPHASGVAALLWSIAPDATATQIEDAMFSSADDLGDPGLDIYYGYGLVDAFTAARELAPGLSPRTHAIRR